MPCEHYGSRVVRGAPTSRVPDCHLDCHQGWVVLPVLLLERADGCALRSRSRCGFAARSRSVAGGVGFLTTHSHLAVSIGWSGTTGARS